MKSSSKVVDELPAGLENLRFCTPITSELLPAFALLAGAHPPRGGKVHKTAAKALSMPLPNALKDGSLS
jgi:hypothetical protein